ncbi:MAG: polyketide synthase [Candidatus Marinimicrobia bacterium]|nr:polyketide synthase [Candidatus Neomarinimicrobiota bacterium]|tara:strand:+ start:30704 stop:32254 length:1551 start_codon:yes stop_codon:yes gene_type:complete
MNSYKYKEQLFLHLDGIGIIPTISALNEIGILKFLTEKDSFILNDIENTFQVNKGYLNVAIRTLSCIGLFEIKDQNEKKVYIINKNKLNIINSYTKDYNLFIKLINLYVSFKNLSNDNEYLSYEQNQILEDTIQCLEKKQTLKNSKNSTEFFLYYFIEGIIVGPILSYLGYHKKSINDIKNQKFRFYIEKIFQIANILDNNKNNTEKGKFLNDRLAAYGVTSSYLPLLSNLKSIISKNTNLVWKRDKTGNEIHVNRGMNVWGSGGAHKYYFKQIDKIIIDIFNKNINEQPKGIIDIGCGDGSFLKHCFDIIKNNTKRGLTLQEHPITLIGVDINKEARIASRRKLNSYNINNIILNGNISSPESLNKKLSLEYNTDLNDFLSTRTFLDHNRIYEEPKEIKEINITTSGSFCYKGKYINQSQLINNLIEHFSKWKKYVNKYGLIILELHTINPKLTMLNRGKTLACAYDTTHGFSDQYLVEYDTFIKCAKVAKLNLQEESILFPNKEIPTISINHFS